jgi:amino acid permease
MEKNMMKEDDRAPSPSAGIHETYEYNPEAAHFPGQNIEYQITSADYQLERGLKSRHIQFLALGKSSSIYKRIALSARQSILTPIP